MKTRRRWLLLVLAPLAVVLLLVAAVLIWPAPLLESVIRDRLAAQGLSPVRLTVAEAGLSSITLSDIALGPTEELTAERIVVGYDLFAGQVQRVDIERPRLTLDLASGGPPLGGLQPLLDGESSGSRPAVPPVEIAGGSIEAATPLGPARVSFDGGLQESAEGALDGRFRLEAEGGPASLAGTLEVSLAADGGLDASLSVERGSVSLSAEETGVSAEIGGLTGSLEASVRDGLPERVAGKLALTDLGLDQARFREAAVDFTLAGDALDAEGSLRSLDDGLRLAFRSRVEDLLDAPKLNAGVSVAASAEAALFELVTLPLSKGLGQLAVSLRGRLPALAAFGADHSGGTTADQILAWLFGGTVEGRFETRLQDLAVPQRLAGLDAAAKGSLLLADGAAAITLEPGAAGRLDSLDRAWLDSLGLPDQLEAITAKGLTFEIAAAEPLPAAVLLRPLPAAWEIVVDGGISARPPDGEGPTLGLALRQGHLTLGAGLAFVDLPDLAASARGLRVAGAEIAAATLEGTLFGQADELEAKVTLGARVERLRRDGLSLGGLSLDLPLSVSLLGGAVEAWADGPGRLSVAQLSHSSGLRLARPAKLTLRDGTLLSSPPGVPGTGGGGLTHDLRFAVGPIDLVMAEQGAEPMPIALRPGRLRVIGERPNGGRYRGRASLGSSQIEFTSLGMLIKSLSLQGSFDATFSAPKASFDGELSYLNLPPLSLEGEARKRGKTVSFDAVVGNEGAQRLLQGAQPSLSGSYDLDSGGARFSLSPLRLAFAPGRLQPADLSPALAELSAVTGSLAVQAEGSWSSGRLGGKGAVQLGGLSFTRGDVAVSGLDLGLTLDSLWPPQSRPGQRLAVRRIDSALPVEALDASFRLQPGSPVSAVIDRVTFGLAGGRFQVRGVTVDPSSQSHRATIEVTQMDIANLFGLLDIEGLTGKGQFAGRLPVSIAGTTVTIADGRLESTAPGVLSYRRAASGPALPDAEADAAALLQDPLELTLRALENFQYNRLVLGVDKKADGKAALKVELDGKNPDLLDGYPFRFNINLTGDVTPILDALERGLDLTQDLLGRSWKLQ